MIEDNKMIDINDTSTMTEDRKMIEDRKVIEDITTVDCVYWTTGQARRKGGRKKLIDARAVRGCLKKKKERMKLFLFSHRCRDRERPPGFFSCRKGGEKGEKGEATRSHWVEEGDGKARVVVNVHGFFSLLLSSSLRG